MIRKYEKNEYMDLVGRAIDKVTGGSCVIIFYGSILTERFCRTSDIDVAIYCKNTLDSTSYLKILDEVEKLPILREVDLIDLNKIQDINLLENVLEKGRVWKNSNTLLKDLENRLKSLRKS